MLNPTLTHTLDTFLQIFFQHEDKEWINGEWIARMPGGFLHSLIIKRLFVLLLALEQQGLGEVYQETAFVVTSSPQWVKGSRIPDVQYMTADRLAVYRQQNVDWRDKPFLLVPDLAIEVISPNDQYVDVLKKAELYLQDGVQRVWLVEPQTQIITVQSQGNPQQQIYRAGNTLTDQVLLPELSISLSALFGD